MKIYVGYPIESNNPIAPIEIASITELDTCDSCGTTKVGLGQYKSREAGREFAKWAYENITGLFYDGMLEEMVRQQTKDKTYD